ncbi:MAG: hypothetical protein QF790_11145 [Gammaproteobacteria bacterium]|jgi:hypothetical protein|nr:hypothetical protein [Gammaproteobacteria bacterium]MDP6617711.1 hypothetical protein [Gammaproteobacteria bacterium]MDP6695680.1 hypothetical protein [Gammaproteobacteria bacterium]
MDRNAPISIVTAIVVSVVGVFALMIQPMIIPIYAGLLGFTDQEGLNILIAEVGGGALASIIAIFWINKINWRLATTVALVCVIVGNLLTTVQTDPATIMWIRLIVGFLGQGTAFAIGISIIGNTSDPDRNFGFVISCQVAFGVVALATLPLLTAQFANIGGMYMPLAALAAVGLLFIKFVPAGPAHREAVASDSPGGSLALPITGLVAMLIWCCGLGAMWGFIALIGEAGGLDSVLSLRALSISSAVAITGSLGAAALAAKGVNRFMPVTIALVMQMIMAWFLQGEMNLAEMAIKASIFQIFWNMTGPFFMGGIAASDSGGKVSVLMPAAQTSGFFIGPAVVGIFLEGTGLVAVTYTTIGFCVVALAMFIPLSARLKAAGY